ncbi:MAG: alkene reductase [Betaproteobacteria bacterium]|nr:alkene reductase [Betaproteobacteria bacterium]
MTIDLYSPLLAGELRLANRLVMAPMARRRAAPSGVPSEHAPLYYSQRATGGLVISEGTAPSAFGKGSFGMPGVYNEEQMAGWRKVTDAVHARGGRMVVQLMHSGRVAHSSRMPGGAMPVSSSSVRVSGQVMTAGGMKDYETPRALDLDEIPMVIEEYACAARCAMAAGFDGVELHGASGFLPMQFLCSSTNQRADAYGGSAANRARFTVEVLEAMAIAIGAGRVGIKISPENPHNDISDAHPVETFSTLVSAISALGIAYLHMSFAPKASANYLEMLRRLFKGAFFIGGGLDRDLAATLIAEGKADAAVYGVKYLANPDLRERFESSTPLNPPDGDTFYSQGPKGYIDYPFMNEART